MSKDEKERNISLSELYPIMVVSDNQKSAIFLDSKYNDIEVDYTPAENEHKENTS